MTVVLIAASTAIKLFQRWVTDTQRINDLEKLTIHTELEQLKNQINPHFLFNMLNNAHVLTQTDPPKASQLLLKLSDMLRYQLYDSTRTKVLLTSDIQFLTDFLNLEKTRRDNFEFIVYTNGQLSGMQVTPLLYITFVENAVKHNGDSDNQSFVHLFFDANDERLYFKCINSKPHTEMPKYGLGGLGLANVKRRLQLLYPDKHVLEIKDEKDTFTVNLLIRT
ncbi:MAG: histidine kinase [Flavipsychrobacter sp.]|nr:histidine kinase [Flavipsychrobacter sp.]